MSNQQLSNQASSNQQLSNQQLPFVPTESCCTSLRSAPLREEQAGELAVIFKALGDPIRLRLLSMIAAAEAETGICVCELTPAFELSQPTISHHLKQLRQAGLVDCERRGTWVHYWLRPESMDKLAMFLAHPGHPAPPGARRR